MAKLAGTEGHPIVWLAGDRLRLEVGGNDAAVRALGAGADGEACRGDWCCAARHKFVTRDAGRPWLRA